MTARNNADLQAYNAARRTAASLVARGFSSWIADRLADAGLSVENVEAMSPYAVLNAFLEWEGIIGFTGIITAAIADIEAAKKGSVHD